MNILVGLFTFILLAHYSHAQLYEQKLSVLQNENLQDDTVDVKVFYECHCPDCRRFDSNQFVPTVEMLESHLNLRMIPYGKASTDEVSDSFECQHGPAECYGNKLHACAIDALPDITEAIFFNSCMMSYSQAGKGSDDRAADACAKSRRVNADPIKRCAKGERGTLLLKQYGEESRRAKFQYVPHILVNEEQSNATDFMVDVCEAFSDPPPACRQLLQDV